MHLTLYSKLYNTIENRFYNLTLTCDVTQSTCGWGSIESTIWEVALLVVVAIDDGGLTARKSRMHTSAQHRPLRGGWRPFRGGETLVSSWWVEAPSFSRWGSTGLFVVRKHQPLRSGEILSNRMHFAENGSQIQHPRALLRQLHSSPTSQLPLLLSVPRDERPPVPVRMMLMTLLQWRPIVQPLSFGSREQWRLAWTIAKVPDNNCEGYKRKRSFGNLIVVISLTCHKPDDSP